MKKKQILAMGLSAVLACTSLPAAFAADESTQMPSVILSANNNYVVKYA